MRRLLITIAVVLLGAGLAAWVGAGDAERTPEWAVNATIIEACSCPMFCQCYFNPRPAAHGGHHGHGESDHFCRFNMAFKINRGHYGSQKLDGRTFWVAGDLGSDFSDGRMDWAVMTFDKGTTEAEREGILAFIGGVFQVEWDSFRTDEGEVSWRAGNGTAHALLDGGRSGEIKLANAATAARKNEPVVIRNLQYWSARSNDGFVLMPNEVEAWRKGDKAFEFRGTNGFMITIDADSASARGAKG